MKVGPENLLGSISMRAGFVFIGDLYTNWVRGDLQNHPARSLYLQPVLRTGKSTRENFACVSPFLGTKILNPGSFHSWRRDGQLVSQMRRNVRIGFVIEVTQTNGQSGYLAVSSGPSCSMSAVYK